MSADLVGVAGFEPETSTVSWSDTARQPSVRMVRATRANRNHLGFTGGAFPGVPRLFCALLLLPLSLAVSSARVSAVSSCDRVTIVGDSLEMWVGGEALRARFAAAGVPVLVDARVGRSVNGGRRRVVAIRAEHGDSECWVVALGTNDAWGSAGAGSGWRRVVFGWRVRAMLAEIGADHRVWWVNVATRRAGLARSFGDFNAALSAAGVVVVDHAGLMAVAGGWAGDGVHLSGAGYWRRAGLVAGAVG